MLQVQLVPIDRKIDGQVGAARAELAALLEEKSLAFKSQLRRLDARTDELNDAMRGLKRMEFLSNGEFEKFWNEVRESLGSGSGIDVDLDQVCMWAREIATREIEKHAVDGIGKVDYAVASARGRVVHYSAAYDAGQHGILSAFLGGDYSDPQKMLQPSFGELGQCFAI